jgi:hypothetical protein
LGILIGEGIFLAHFAHVATETIFPDNPTIKTNDKHSSYLILSDGTMPDLCAKRLRDEFY